MAEGSTGQNSDGSWQFKQDDVVVSGVVNEPAQPQAPDNVAQPDMVAMPPNGPEGSITWTASEFVAHDKAAGWYVAVAGAAVLLAILAWLITKDKVLATMIIICAAFFAFYGARKPRQLQYGLDAGGISIGEKYFPFRQFRSFAIVTEGAFKSIDFIPLKRFSPLISIYYDPADEPKIVALLSERLPVSHRERAMIDRLMWRLRF